MVPGKDREWQTFIEAVEKISPSNTPILIQGGSDSCRENLAKAAHGFSPRRNAAFEVVHCARFSSDELERTLFGDQNNKNGLILTADGGTLFLDSIEACRGPLQLRLSRMLDQGWSHETKEGETTTANVRLIVGTTCNLQTMVWAGQFLDDLLYRINTITLRIPPVPEG